MQISTSKLSFGPSGSGKSTFGHEKGTYNLVFVVVNKDMKEYLRRTADEVDRAGITAFRDTLSLLPARQLILVVRLQKAVSGYATVNRGSAQDVRGCIMKSLKLRISALFIVLGALLPAAGVAYLLPQRKVVIDAAFYEQLKVGMSEAEVDATCPIPPGDHTRAYAYVTSRPTCQGELPIYIDYYTHADGTVSAPHPLTGRPICGKWWRGEDGQVLIFFGDDQRVIERRYYPGYPRSWVGYQLDRLVR